MHTFPKILGVTLLQSIQHPDKRNKYTTYIKTHRNVTIAHIKQNMKHIRYMFHSCDTFQTSWYMWRIFSLLIMVFTILSAFTLSVYSFMMYYVVVLCIISIVFLPHEPLEPIASFLRWWSYFLLSMICGPLSLHQRRFIKVSLNS